jgi:hypothetical protein
MRVSVDELYSLLLCVVLIVEKKALSTTHNRREYNPPNETRMRIKETYTTYNISNNRRHQFPRPVILTPDDDHIGRNI